MLAVADHRPFFARLFCCRRISIDDKFCVFFFLYFLLICGCNLILFSFLQSFQFFRVSFDYIMDNHIMYACVLCVYVSDIFGSLARCAFHASDQPYRRWPSLGTVRTTHTHMSRSLSIKVYMNMMCIVQQQKKARMLSAPPFVVSHRTTIDVDQLQRFFFFNFCFLQKKTQNYTKRMGYLDIATRHILIQFWLFIQRNGR